MVLSELGIAGPVLFVLNAPVLTNQAQQRCWHRPEAREEPVPDPAGA
jgi:hypothetical protein